jgi:hypothetical protein
MGVAVAEGWQQGASGQIDHLGPTAAQRPGVVSDGGHHTVRHGHSIASRATRVARPNQTSGEQHLRRHPHSSLKLNQFQLR